jgi:adenylate kinase family enzyme
MDFPIFNSKKLSDGNKYNLTDRSDRYKYFHAKLGTKIDAVKEYIDNGGTFVGYMLAKKQAGKGTYSKMIEEILDPERFSHLSVGDLVRDAHANLEDLSLKKTFTDNIIKHYRGVMPVSDALDSIVNRSQDKVSVPTEMVLALLKMEIDKLGRKALFIDGLPRTYDQVSYSLYFRQLINYRDDPDFFILIDVPEAIIDGRMKNRVVCPVCHTSKSLLINPTKIIKYDKDLQQIYFICDNPHCAGYEQARYVSKEGDLAGIESIRARLEDDQKLMDLALNLEGIPKVLIRSDVPVSMAKDYLEDYEIQESYKFEVDAQGNVEKHTKPWEFKNDSGVPSYTYYAATYVLNLFNQIHDLIIG